MDKEVDLSVNIAGIELEHPLMNAAGTCKVLEGKEGIYELARSATSAILIGSITTEPREVNSGEVYWSGKFYSLNSMGLPNPGVEYYRKYLPEMVRLAHRVGKPLFVSVAGFSVSEYADLAELAFQGGADLVELNLSCPSIWREGVQSPIACFRPQMVEEILRHVEKRFGAEAKIAVKLSPFSDPSNLSEVAQVIGESRVVKVVTAVNTFPNAFSFDEKGKSRITPEEGLAGFGGRGIKPISLGQVKQLRKTLPKNIHIIGVGGITTGKDIKEYQRKGAVAVQIATILLDKGPGVFSILLDEYLSIKMK